jgi:hypothetical protein
MAFLKSPRALPRSAPKTTENNLNREWTRMNPPRQAYGATGCEE